MGKCLYHISKVMVKYLIPIIYNMHGYSINMSIYIFLVLTNCHALCILHAYLI